LNSLRSFSYNNRFFNNKLNDYLYPLIGLLQRNKKISTKINALSSLSLKTVSKIINKTTTLAYQELF